MEKDVVKEKERGERSGLRGEIRQQGRDGSGRFLVFLTLNSVGACCLQPACFRKPTLSHTFYRGSRNEKDDRKINRTMEDRDEGG